VEEDDDDVQQERADEEVRSLPGSEGRKVRWENNFLLWVVTSGVKFLLRLCFYLTERSQFAAFRRPNEPDTHPGGGALW